MNIKQRLLSSRHFTALAMVMAVEAFRLQTVEAAVQVDNPGESTVYDTNKAPNEHIEILDPPEHGELVVNQNTGEIEYLPFQEGVNDTFEYDLVSEGGGPIWLLLGAIAGGLALIDGGSDGQPRQIDRGDAPDSFKTLSSSDGAAHVITNSVILGSRVDGDDDGIPTIGADGDDIGDGPNSDDEDGVVFPGSNYYFGSEIPIEVTIGGEGDGFLSVWVDFNLNGEFDLGEELELDEGPDLYNYEITAGDFIDGTFHVHFPVEQFEELPDPHAFYQVYVRARVAGEEVDLPTGLVNSGEVEDHVFTLWAAYDFGDLPEEGTDFNTSYENGGPGHLLNGTLYLGEGVAADDDYVDHEHTGQASPMANGDDYDGNDDEEGVSFRAEFGDEVLYNVVSPHATNFAEVEIGGEHDGYLNAWIDLNGNLAFDEGEKVIDNMYVEAGDNVEIDFELDEEFEGEAVFSRWRVSDAELDSPDGLVVGGEVEDHKTEVYSAMDFGDAPESYGTSTNSYINDDAAIHYIVPGSVILGESVTPEDDGIPTASADSDDNNNLPDDDEDGVSFEDIEYGFGENINIELYVGGQTGSDGFLSAWADFNFNGTFDEDEHITFNNTEIVLDNLEVSSANGFADSFNIPMTLELLENLGVDPDEIEPGDCFYTYLRFRVANEEIEGPTGVQHSGEVEDYLVRMKAQFDFGDLQEPRPEENEYLQLEWEEEGGPDYHTLFDNNGARHLLNNTLFFGEYVDADYDGVPQDDAMGDDLLDPIHPFASDDEDGVFFQGNINGELMENMISYSNTSLAYVQVGGDIDTQGFVSAWVDLNNDGDFDDEGEWIIQDYAVNGGDTLLADFKLVEGYVGDTVNARFRIADHELGELGYNGLAIGGEVEDYTLKVVPDDDYGDAPDSYGTSRDNFGARHAIVPGLILGDEREFDDDGHPVIAADGDDTGDTDIDDEDGVTFDGLNYEFGEVINLQAIIKMQGDYYGDGKLSIWHDKNFNGEFDYGEQIVLNNGLKANDADNSGTIDLGEALAGVVYPDGTAIDNLDVSNMDIINGDFQVFAPFDLEDMPDPGEVFALYIRARIANDDVSGPTGPEASGEVEDYVLVITATYDFGDLPDAEYGENFNFHTRLEDGGPAHLQNGSLYLGEIVDTEFDGLPTLLADGDDIVDLPDDDDGVSFFTEFDDFEFANFFSTTGENEMVIDIGGDITNVGYLNAWVDLNGDGEFTSDEQVIENEAVIGGSTEEVDFNLELDEEFNGDMIFARVRVSDHTLEGPDGLAIGGEVEDYAVSLIQSDNIDYGDLPVEVETFNEPYIEPTSYGEAGATMKDGVYLGQSVDADDGYPEGVNTATIDDDTNLEDEDGVSFNGGDQAIYLDTDNDIDVEVGPDGGFVYGYVDLNMNLTFDEDELVFNQYVDGNESASGQFFMPDPGEGGTQYVYARFIIVEEELDTPMPNGLFINGEVEDYSLDAYFLGA